MVNFYVYDITFFILFTIAVTYFLYQKRDSLSREGWMFMYRTKWGVQAMDWFDKKFHSTLGVLRYVIVTIGFVLMITMMWLLAHTLSLYITRPDITNQIKAPPVAPLIPYFPELFGLKGLFPPFYFTYFLVALAIVAIVHEFSHGIYMRYSKTKIKSTGLVFLGPILGAFVEEDQKSFYSKNRLNQMAVLGAGVFANVLFAILFYLLYVGFFYLTFVPSGFVYNGYYVEAVNASVVDMSSLSTEGNFTVFLAGDKKYYLDSTMKDQLSFNQDLIIAYYDAPAFKIDISPVHAYGGRPYVQGRTVSVAITAIDGKPVVGEESLSMILDEYKAGDEVVIDLVVNDEAQQHTIVLGAHPQGYEKGYLGVAYTGLQSRSVFQKIIAHLGGFRIDSTYYAPKYDADLIYFFYHLLWWVMIINLLVALFNMLPLGILDGGRFFYLAVEKVSNKSVAEKAFKLVTWLIAGIFILLLLIWVIRLF